MISEMQSFADLVEGSTQQIEFKVTAAMVERFAQLTGDFSSLHVDRAFGRRSSYRDNVVHGMLPVLYIAGLSGFWRDGYRCYLHSISGRFLKPVFADSRLVLEAKVISLEESQLLVEAEYILKHKESGATVTTGFFTLRYVENANVTDKLEASEPVAPRLSLLADPVEEEELQLEEIQKGDEKQFDFHLVKEHISSLYQLLIEGLLPAHQLDFSFWTAHYNPATLLANCLSSTFIGMCIPGKYATFMDFQASFQQPVQWNKTYTFSGKVRFASSSTNTVTENISIHSAENDEKVIASGKLSAKVNEPPIQMPSIDVLQDSALDLQLRDKVVLITGASRGIGETAAKLFSLHGAKVAVNYFRGEDDAQCIVDEIVSFGGQALAVQADVTDREQVRRMVKTICAEYGTVHILVNNAVGNFYPTSFLELTWNDFQKDIDVVIKGAFHCCQEVLPLMMNNGGGKIVNISTVATEVPPSNQAKYVVAKSGLVGLTRSLAVEFASHNIQVNMVSPSIVETDLTKHVSKIFLEGMKNDTPMQRNASPVDVAKAVVFLASSLAPFTTGQKVMVTGGNAPFL